MRDRLQLICSPVKVSCFGDFGGGGGLDANAVFVDLSSGKETRTRKSSRSKWQKPRQERGTCVLGGKR